MEHVKTVQDVLAATKELQDFLGLKGIQVVQGGPSPSDPEGNIQWYVGFRDGSNGFHFGIDEFGQIAKCGATIRGRVVTFPIVETLK